MTTFRIQAGHTMLSLIIWIVIISTTFPLLSSTLILTAHYYSKTVQLLLAISEQAFLKAVIQHDLMSGTLLLAENGFSILSDHGSIVYSISASRLKRNVATSRYVTSFLRIDYLEIVNLGCFKLYYLNPHLNPLLLCQPSVLNDA